MDNTVTEMINAFEEFASSIKQKNHRYLSWEHCYQQFRSARLERDKKEPDLDYLSLQLAFYLASWGMYRGSSFLLQRDYKVHIPIVKEILKSEYDCLQGLECDNLLADKIVQERLVEIDTKLEQFYKAIRQSVVNKDIKNSISKILITKVLLGTLGCTPAYDRFFILGARKTKVTSGLFSLHSMKRLAAFYEENKSQFEAVREKYRIGDQRYPQMKLLDMVLWQIGTKSKIGKTNSLNASGLNMQKFRHYVAVAQRFNHLKILQSPLNLQFNGDFYYVRSLSNFANGKVT